MGKVVSLMKSEFKRSPLWQKVLVVVLFAFLFFYFAISPFFGFLKKEVLVFDYRRDVLFKRLQEARYLVDDADIIRQKYRALVNQIAGNSFYLGAVKQNLDGIFKSYSKNIAKLDFHDISEQTFDDKVATLSLTLDMQISPDKIPLLLANLESYKYSRINSFDYRDNRLELNMEVVTSLEPNINLLNRGSAIKNVVVSNVPQRAPLQDNDLNGFFTLGDEISCIIKGKLYSVGDKVNNYVIKEINLQKRLVVLLGNGQQLVLSQRKG